eukprot:TRINITY_DN14276_c0_g6_i1.p3 TRINITY_DN14276_c0_g6~~TRINITY_DN14276_c0_g6_i1.p3  ORF type:complete len:305 (-),score=27.34 TRINITY_DN14276_c0_g6_i1:706-1545(-)
MTDQLFTFGKYRGKRFSLVVQIEQSYCVWALEVAHPQNQLLKFIEYLENIQVLDKFVVQFGQFQGKSFEWVYKNDPGYCSWALQQQPKLKELKLFQHYLEKKQVEQQGCIPNGYCASFMQEGGCSLPHCYKIHNFPANWSKEYCHQWREQFKNAALQDKAKDKQSREANNFFMGESEASNQTRLSRAAASSKKTSRRSQDDRLSKIDGEEIAGVKKYKPKKTRKISKPKVETGVSTTSKSVQTQQTCGIVEQAAMAHGHSVGTRPVYRPVLKVEYKWLT